MADLKKPQKGFAIVSTQKDTRFRSRKYHLAWAIAVGSFVLAQQQLISGAEWVTACGLILGLYGAANVGDSFADKK